MPHLINHSRQFQSRCCAQGLRRLAQVVLAYLDVSTMFFPGITSGTVSPGLVSKYPGRAPKARFSCGVRVSGVWVVLVLRVAGLVRLGSF